MCRMWQGKCITGVWARMALVLLVLSSSAMAFASASRWRLHARTTLPLHRPKMILLMAEQYCKDTTRTIRRDTRTCQVGPVPIGSAHPVARQTMCTTVTKDVEASVAQVMKIADEGGMLARLTVQGKFEADACAKIRESLTLKGYDIPLVADIHFSPNVALRAADSFEKIRINPGNFADGMKSFDEKVYNNREEYDEAVPTIDALLKPLVMKCKENNRAMRIGTNHGSLSARVLSYWGDTPRGMVESAIEFARICRKYDFHDFVFSMKASNPLIMVQAYRLLASEMYKLGWDYPLHLGVTEAGEGEDGRMKSAIGIGTLLSDGLGDTIRVSLTEDPEYELKPCSTLARLGHELMSDASQFADIPFFEETGRDFANIIKRKGDLPTQQEGDMWDVRGIMHRDGSVFCVVTPDDLKEPEHLYSNLGAKLVVGMPFKDVATTDSIYLTEVPISTDVDARKALKRLQDVSVGVFADRAQLIANPLANSVAVIDLSELAAAGALPPLPEGSVRWAVRCSGLESEECFSLLTSTHITDTFVTLLLSVPSSSSRVHASRRVFELLHRSSCNVPVVHTMDLSHAGDDKDELILRAGMEAGALLVDGLGDGVLISSKNFGLDMLRTTSFNLLQGCRMRSIKTDFVSCPSCGRTLFDLQDVTEQIKVKTGHLPGVTIAIMGCIVNGPGEMADADFGYVGGAPGKVDLYVGKEVVKRAIPNAEACDALVELIKENGRWQDRDKMVI